MRRVVILGAGGAGKSELSRELSRRTGLPAVHLDVLFWQPAPAAEAAAALAAAVGEECWVIDGNFLGADRHDRRFERADTVMFLDLPRWLCLWRAIKRLVRDRRRRRPDLPDGCDEGFDPELLRWIWRYRRTDRPAVLALLARLAPTTDVHRLRSPAAVRAYLATVDG